MFDFSFILKKIVNIYSAAAFVTVLFFLL